MQTLTDLNLPKHVHVLTLIFSISGLFIENENKFLIYFSKIFYHVYSITAYGHYITRVGIPKVLACSYSGAGVS